jgi:5-(carboxyamino)imidazole ribonucleotide synthase
MFAHAAQALGYRVAVLEPDPMSPTGAVAERHIVASYLDEAGLADLADAAAAVTIEFENVPAASLRALAQRRPVSPSAAAVEICQDRAAEKSHFRRTGVPCAPFAFIRSEADLAGDAVAELLPGFLKTARLGYDGKGQAIVDTPAALVDAWQRLGRVPCVLEKKLPLRRELSVIVARAADGSLVHLPVQQNLHRDGILAVTQAPGPDIDEATAALAVRQCALAAGRHAPRGRLAVRSRPHRA